MNHVLDNPIWNALNSGDVDKNIGSQEIAFFDSSIAPFIGMDKWDTNSQQGLLMNAPADRNWYLLIGDTIRWNDDFEILLHIPLYQMCCTKSPLMPNRKYNTEIVALNDTHIDEMVQLTALTKPGPFTNRTIDFGNYHGIFVDGKLVAMGGERMHVHNYTEVSAICTHPDYRGLGYAAMITHYITQSIVQKGQIPFLHSRVDNMSAIEVYKKLGFEIRETIQFYSFKKK